MFEGGGGDKMKGKYEEEKEDSLSHSLQVAVRGGPNLFFKRYICPLQTGLCSVSAFFVSFLFLPISVHFNHHKYSRMMACLSFYLLKQKSHTILLDIFCPAPLQALATG